MVIKDFLTTFISIIYHLKIFIDKMNVELIKDVKLSFSLNTNSEYPSTFSIEFYKLNEHFRIKFVKLNEHNSYPIGSANIYYTKDGSPAKFEENDSKMHQVYKFLKHIHLIFIRSTLILDCKKF